MPHGYSSSGACWQDSPGKRQQQRASCTCVARLPTAWSQYARDEEKAPQIFLDDRHGHPYKLTAPVQAWISDVCTDNAQMPSSQVQSELKSRFGVTVSVSQINRVRAKLGVSHLWRGRTQGPSKKN